RAHDLNYKAELTIAATVSLDLSRGLQGWPLDHESGFLIKVSVLRAGSGSGCRAGAPGSTVRRGLFFVVGSAVQGSGRGGQGPHCVPGVDEVAGPWPVRAQVQPPFPLAAGQA